MNISLEVSDPVPKYKGVHHSFLQHRPRKPVSPHLKPTHRNECFSIETISMVFHRVPLLFPPSKVSYQLKFQWIYPLDSNGCASHSAPSKARKLIQPIKLQSRFGKSGNGRNDDF